MQPADIHNRLTEKFGSRITGAKLDVLDPWTEVAPEALLEVARFVKDDSQLQFDALNDLCAVDYFDSDAKKTEKLGGARLEVVYHLYSYQLKHYLVLKVKLPRWKADQAGSLPELASVASVWDIADWHEREAFDLMGIQFVGHPNLRRILCPEDWVGHALRKDYEFPLEYHGIRGR